LDFASHQRNVRSLGRGSGTGRNFGPTSTRPSPKSPKPPPAIRGDDDNDGRALDFIAYLNESRRTKWCFSRSAQIIKNSDGLCSLSADETMRQVMNTIHRLLALAIFGLLVIPRTSLALDVLVDQSFEQFMQGDDPSGGVFADLPFNPNLPIRVTLDAFAENLNVNGDIFPADTGIRFYLQWWQPGVDEFDGIRFFDGDYNGFHRLPGVDPIRGSTRVPFYFDEEIHFTPSRVLFGAEGGGCCDNIRFAGNFTILQVPEPNAGALLLGTTTIGLFVLLLRSLRSVRWRSSGAQV
jgi:hypothetical protein